MMERPALFTHAALENASVQAGPFGPQRILQDGPERWILRLLKEERGFLRVGATLQGVARCAHPRLRSPRYWWRDEEGPIWIATALPEGHLLAQGFPERPVFSEALSWIVPLALALRDAHRQGLVHGALSPHTLYLQESPHRALSAVELGSGLLEATEASLYTPPERRADHTSALTPAADIYSLARILIALAIRPDEALRESPNLETIPAYAIPTLDRALNARPDQRPRTIDAFLAGLRFAPGAPTTPGEQELLRGRVHGLETFERPGRGAGFRFRLGRADADTSDAIFVYEAQAPELFQELQSLQEGAEVHLLSPGRIQDSRGREFLTAAPESALVVEPHWPVSVTDVLTARGCPSRVFVDLRDSGSFSYHLPFGNLVHRFLEELVADDTLVHQDVLDTCLPSLRLDFLAAGVGDEELADLVQTSAEHFAYLRQIAARRRSDGPGERRVGWSGHHAEVTRFSTRYGLEGRTDLVVNDPDRGLQILELKTGKPWHDHAGQVESYALLWEEWARRENAPLSGYLLYSRTGELKEVPLSPGAPVSLLRGRNHLLSAYQHYADPASAPRPPHYMEHPGICRENACRFRRDRCQAQTDLLGLGDSPALIARARPELSADLLDRARAYHAHFSSLVERERWADHLEMGSIFRPERLEDRVAEGRAAADLELQPHVEGTATLRGAGVHVFSPGDTLLLHRGPVESTQILRARVLQGGDDEIVVRAFSQGLDPDHAGAGWAADRLPARIGYQASHRALYRTLTLAQPSVLSALLLPREPSANDAAPPSPGATGVTLQHLNASQQKAVDAALQDRPITLIQGPPGTGKTTVAAHLAMDLLGRGKKLLLSALTNTAVDTLVLKVLDAARDRGEQPPRILRLSSAERSPTLASALRDRGLKSEEIFADDLGVAATSQERLANHLRSAEIIATTAHRSLRHPVLTFLEATDGALPIDVALVDEATQVTEPMALAPLSFARRAVLLGDQKQLPPIVTGELSLSSFLEIPDGPLREAEVQGLNRSLFERLAILQGTHLLTVQYRMHRDIMAFPSAHYYEGRITADESCADRGLDAPEGELPAPLHPAPASTFLHVEGTEHHRTNQAEARALARACELLLKAYPSASLGVISPFRSQVHLLRRTLPSSNRLQIDTVERFQGNERDIILLSAVKTAEPGEFLADPRRLNVALTRARKKFILFGARPCLEKDPQVRAWLASPTTQSFSWTDHF